MHTVPCHTRSSLPSPYHETHINLHKPAPPPPLYRCFAHCSRHGTRHGTRQVLDGALFDVPIAVLHNKEDLPFALADDAIAAALKWPELAAREGPIRAFRCSVLRGTGYTDALQWLARFC